MNLHVKKFEELTIDELYEILRVRAEVFVVEQTCVYQDLDGVDKESLHAFYEEDGKVCAYVRIFKKKDEISVAQLGRLLTTRRGEGLGWKILQEGLHAAMNRLFCREVYIEAQCYAVPFYEKAGFLVTSEEFLEDGIPHVEMRTADEAAGKARFYYDLVKEYKRQHEVGRYSDLAPDEVTFDVMNINGHGYRAISDLLADLKEKGKIRSYGVWGMGEGQAFFTEEALKEIGSEAE